jgi:hypothetical protein
MPGKIIERFKRLAAENHLVLFLTREETKELLSEIRDLEERDDSFDLEVIRRAVTDIDRIQLRDTDSETVRNVKKICLRAAEMSEELAELKEMVNRQIAALSKANDYIYRLEGRKDATKHPDFPKPITVGHPINCICEYCQTIRRVRSETWK